MSSSLAAGIRQNKIRGIGADSQHHVGSMIANGGERMGCKVVEEHVTGRTSFFGRGSLLVGNFIESGDDRGITAAGII
jgi:hypothetical protein